MAEHRLNHIEYLTIDTEGYDGATLLNSIDILNAFIACMIEFEYHNIGTWPRVGQGSTQASCGQAGCGGLLLLCVG